ncbi:hypothetical protein ACFE04_026319 [Oxalis oulophora]
MGKKMKKKTPQHWFTGFQTRFSFRNSSSHEASFRHSSNHEITIAHSPSTSEVSIIRGTDPRISSPAQQHNRSSSVMPIPLSIELTKEEQAAITIQTSFRSHLAKRALRALRSLVKLQALVRGVLVRRQARIAIQCMHALVKLQVRVRARQLLTQYSDDN